MRSDYFYKKFPVEVVFKKSYMREDGGVNGEMLHRVVGNQIAEVEAYYKVEANEEVRVDPQEVKDDLWVKRNRVTCGV